MGIRFTCPSGHKLHVKSFLAGKRGVCPQCGAKFTIPFEEEPQRVAAGVRAEVGGLETADLAAPVSAPAADLGSQSIIISIADSTTTAAPPVMGPIVIPEPVVSAPPAPTPIIAPPNIPVPPTPTNGSVDPTIILTPIFAPQPLVMTNPIEPASPASLYVAKRSRSRRNQFTFAIVLFVAVIVLAGVLIWVLKYGPNAAPAENTRPTGGFQSVPSRQVALSVDRSLNTRSAHGAAW